MQLLKYIFKHFKHKIMNPNLVSLGATLQAAIEKEQQDLSTFSTDHSATLAAFAAYNSAYNQAQSQPQQ
jgi:hypothetical protein